MKAKEVVRDANYFGPHLVPIWSFFFTSLLSPMAIQLTPMGHFHTAKLPLGIYSRCVGRSSVSVIYQWCISSIPWGCKGMGARRDLVVLEMHGLGSDGTPTTLGCCNSTSAKWYLVMLCFHNCPYLSSAPTWSASISFQGPRLHCFTSDFTWYFSTSEPHRTSYFMALLLLSSLYSGDTVTVMNFALLGVRTFENMLKTLKYAVWIIPE